MNLEERQFELEKQLHEQYAINNNERMSSLITLFVSLLAVLGAYGYMFLHTTSQSALYFGTLYLGKDKYTIEALMLTASVCFIVTAIMKHLCIYQGSYQRKEQFIIELIRIKYQMKNLRTIFLKDYKPEQKDRDCFIQGVYGELIRIFDCVDLIVLMVSLLRYYYFLTCQSECSMLSLIVMLFVFMVTTIITQQYIDNRFTKYCEDEDEFCKLKAIVQHSEPIIYFY